MSTISILSVLLIATVSNGFFSLDPEVVREVDENILRQCYSEHGPGPQYCHLFSRRVAYLLYTTIIMCMITLTSDVLRDKLKNSDERKYKIWDTITSMFFVFSLTIFIYAYQALSYFKFPIYPKYDVKLFSKVMEEHDSLQFTQKEIGDDFRSDGYFLQDITFHLVTEGSWELTIFGLGLVFVFMYSSYLKYKSTQSKPPVITTEMQSSFDTEITKA